jgi:hypothetical protein
MDPNATLDALRDAMEAMRSMLDDGYAPDKDDACEAFLKFEALDEWLTKGGFLPTDWQRNR